MPAKSRSQGADDLSFEAHLEALEKVVGELEGDALSLEASIDRYKDGVSHLSACRRILDAAEQRLLELVSSPDGTVAERPLVVGAEGLEDAGPPAAATAPTTRTAPRFPGVPAVPGVPGAPRAPAGKPKPPPSPAEDDLPF